MTDGTGDHIPQRCLHNFVLTGTPQSLCILDPSNLASLTHICVCMCMCACVCVCVCVCVYMHVYMLDICLHMVHK